MVRATSAFRMSCTNMSRLKYRKSSRSEKIEVVLYGQAHCLVYLDSCLPQFHKSASADASYDNTVDFMSSQGTKGLHMPWA